MQLCVSSEFKETYMYSSKGQCLRLFERLMSSPDVSEKSAGDYTKDIINEEVRRPHLAVSR